MKFWLKFIHFHSRKYFWNCHLRNGSHLVSASMCWNRYLDGLEQHCSNSSELAMELLQPCTKPSICLCQFLMQKKYIYMTFINFPPESSKILIAHLQCYSVHTPKSYFSYPGPRCRYIHNLGILGVCCDCSLALLCYSGEYQCCSCRKNIHFISVNKVNSPWPGFTCMKLCFRWLGAIRQQANIHEPMLTQIYITI